MMVFTCSNCRRTLSADQFHKDASTKRGYKSQCRDCRTKISPQMNARARQEFIEKEALRQAIYRIITRHRSEFEEYRTEEYNKIKTGNLHITS